MKASVIMGKNPVLEAIKSGHTIEKIMIAKGAEKSMGQIVAAAKDGGIPIYYAERERLDKPAEGGRHQGVLAYVSEYDYVELSDILKRAEERGETPFLVILDGIEDPHNLGAIMRSADGAGAHGIIIPKRRAAGITSVVAKVSAGAVEYMPVARVSNLVRTIEQLKEEGFWIAAADMGDVPYYKADLRGKIALVIGNEGSGISRLVKENCDFVVSLPMKGGVSSLNAASAAAILLYEICRQRDFAEKRIKMKRSGEIIEQG